MSYSVKEIFYTLQGEGANSGTSAVFCRFTGCNLWSGNEYERQRAICRFCDTDFVGTDGTCGGKYESARLLATRIDQLWPQGVSGRRFVVLTGGEPLLQVDDVLIKEFHQFGFRVAIETNGTIHPPNAVDWICVSPKAGVPLVVSKGHELKVVWPQPGMDLVELERLEFDHFFLQPMDSAQRDENVKVCVDICMKNPKWRLSLQIHKMVGIR